MALLLLSLRRALERVGAGPEGVNTGTFTLVLSHVEISTEGSRLVYWTSLREEPVIYVARRPHVLRLVDRPLENVEYGRLPAQIFLCLHVMLGLLVLRPKWLKPWRRASRRMLYVKLSEEAVVFCCTMKLKSGRGCSRLFQCGNMLRRVGFHFQYDVNSCANICIQADILTPREVYEQMVREGYRVDYGRVAIVRRFPHTIS
jgi:hypothetical protein